MSIPSAVRRRYLRVPSRETCTPSISSVVSRASSASRSRKAPGRSVISSREAAPLWWSQRKSCRARKGRSPRRSTRAESSAGVIERRSGFSAMGSTSVDLGSRRSGDEHCGLLGGLARYFHLQDAALVGRFDGEGEAAPDHERSARRHPAGGGGEKSAQRLVVTLFRKIDAEVFLDLAQRDRAIGEDHAVALHAKLLLLDVALVVDLADDLLHHVLEGDDAARAAELVHHDGDVGLAPLHLGEEPRDLHHLRDEERPLHVLGELEVVRVEPFAQ